MHFIFRSKPDIGSNFESTAKDNENFVAFLPNEVREQIKEMKLEAKPYTTKNKGLALFVDVSGFTSLGRRLTQSLPRKEATEKLAEQIMSVLHTLTSVCLEYDGDVAKFCGDALLCTWKLEGTAHSEEELAKLYDKLQQKVESAAYKMLTVVSESVPELDLHGGLCRGSLINLFLGGKSSKLKVPKFRIKPLKPQRWYMVAGSAVAKATELANTAKKGQILIEVSPSIAPIIVTRESRAIYNELLAAQNLSGSLFEWSKELPDDFVTDVRSFIPELVQKKLAGGAIIGGEIRQDVSVMFVNLDYLKLSGAEMDQNLVTKKTLSEINNVFVKFLSEVKNKGGEIRDLLFDDKGCVFIAVFGAHEAVENGEARAVEAARNVIKEFPRAKVGLTSGPSFIGMCGTDERHDFVAISQDVNLASRFSSHAEEGQILLNYSIATKVRSAHSLEKLTIESTSGKNDGSSKCWVLGNRINRQLSLVGSRPYMVQPLKVTDSSTTLVTHIGHKEQSGPKINEIFVGREEPLNTLCANIRTNSNPKVTRIQGRRGVGKTSLLRRLRDEIRDNYDVVYCAASDCEQSTQYYLIKQLMFTLLGLNCTEPDLVTFTEFSYECKTFGLDVIPDVLWETCFKGMRNTSSSEPGVRKTNHTSFNTRQQYPGRQRSNKFNIRRISKKISTFSLKKSIATIDSQVTPTLEEGGRNEEVGAFLSNLIEKCMNRSKHTGMVVLCDDAQWMDFESLLVLGTVSDWIRELQGLSLIITHRPFQNKYDSRKTQVEKIFKETPAGLFSHIILEQFDNPEKWSLVTQMLIRHFKMEKEPNVNSHDMLHHEFKKTLVLRNTSLPSEITLLTSYYLNESLITYCGNTNKFILNTEKAIDSFPESLTRLATLRLSKLHGIQPFMVKVAACLLESARGSFPRTLLIAVLRKEKPEVTEDEWTASLLELLNEGFLASANNKINELSFSKTVRKQPRYQFKDLYAQALLATIPVRRQEAIRAVKAEVEKEMAGNKFI